MLTNSSRPYASEMYIQKSTAARVATSRVFGSENPNTENHIGISLMKLFCCGTKMFKSSTTICLNLDKPETSVSIYLGNCRVHVEANIAYWITCEILVRSS